MVVRGGGRGESVTTISSVKHKCVCIWMYNVDCLPYIWIIAFHVQNSRK